MKKKNINKYNCVIRGNGVVCRHKVLVLEMRIDNEWMNSMISKKEQFDSWCSRKYENVLVINATQDGIQRKHTAGLRVIYKLIQLDD